MSSLRLLVVAALLLCACGCNANGSSPSSATGCTPSATNIVTSGFSQTDLTVGTGATAIQCSRITVAYSGWLYDPSQPEGKGRQFDANPAYTFTLGVRLVIPGWDLGVVGMRVGGQRRLIIPPALGYGNQAVGTIPANSTLIFDIRLISVG